MSVVIKSIIPVLLYLLFIPVFSMAQIKTDKVNSVLWKISTDKSPRTSYILGSVHIFGSAWIDSWPVIDSILTKQDLFVSEHSLNLDNKATSYPTKATNSNLKASDYFGKDLQLDKDHFKKNYNTDLVEYLDTAKNSQALLVGLLQLLLNDFAYNKNLKISEDITSMDDVLLVTAKEKNKPNIGLDDPSQLVEMFSSKEWTTSRASKIIEAVKEANGIKLSSSTEKEFLEFENLIKEYDQGRYDYTDKHVSNAGVKIVDRNLLWMTKLPQLLEKGNCFIVVGIHHLKGNKGLLKLLGEKGFKLTPIELK
ncbi:MAG: TraB/GumN family protein [Flavobacteriales bacterium]|nr:MAG: TraB/GumN family protein [Flavobacteriales bacterium]